MKIKLSDYVAMFLSKQKIEYVFAISGGATIHLIKSLNDARGVNYICPQHEQAGAMAADGYARASGGMGAAIATSGPGATNLITGICCAYYDSIPVIFITGQVSTFRLKNNLGVRQIGFQETDVVEISKSITKYSVMIKKSKDIRYELEKALYIAKSGRPGPVLIDIPDNIQREMLDPNKLRPFRFNAKNNKTTVINNDIEKCIALIKQSKRPVIVLGWGIRLAGGEKELEKLVKKLKFPIACTWAVADIIPTNNNLNVGTFGTHGTRHGNFAIQNADLIISIGSRLDTKATGSPMKTFARGAKKIVVDIDQMELVKFKKYGMKTDILIHADAKEFILTLNKNIRNTPLKNINEWRKKIQEWKRNYPICPDAYHKEKSINPYVFVKTLSKECAKNDMFFVDTGCTLAWVMQAFDFKKGQRIFHDWNNTAMGWALPAAIGGSFYQKNKRVICITGDGSLQMNIQELATVIRHKLPIKIFLINNRGYSMIQQTQDQWLDSKYLASTIPGGLAFPNFIRIAKAYGFKSINITQNSSLAKGLKEALDYSGPVFCNINISSKHRVIPQVKYGRPNEDSDPLLDRKEFINNMIVKPLKTLS